jgi:predicted Zn-dependent protease
VSRTFIETIGFKIGQKAAQAKSAFDLMGGDDDEARVAEIRLGHDMAEAMLRRVPLVEPNESTQFAQQIVKWLGSRVADRRLPFHLYITAEDDCHAMAFPGGPMFMSWGLLDFCRGERDYIAFLVAHEMGHIVLRHTVDRLVQDAALSLLLRKTSGRLAATDWLQKTGKQVLGRAFSRENELAADLFAVDLLKRAGGDPSTAQVLLENLWRALAVVPGQGRGSASNDYFAGHPPFPERIDHLQKHAAPPQPGEAPNSPAPSQSET